MSSTLHPDPDGRPPAADLYEDVIGQERAVAALRTAAGRPVHAYLFVGPSGTGKAAAATSFAASLLCPTGGNHEGLGGVAGCDSCRRVRSGAHPDVVQVEREGASISIDAARQVVRGAYMSPVEGSRKVVILHDFHLVRETGPALLKTIEEPPATTIFVVLAEYLPAELVTIASRCVRIDFQPLAPAAVVDALVAGGVDRARAVMLAEVSSGRLDRARLLASDAGFEARRQAWHSVPGRLDGTGATAARIADELVALLDESVAPLKERQGREAAELAERNARNAEVVSSGRGAKGRPRATKAALSAGIAELEERHRREQRRQRTDELRAGLATLAAAYRQHLTPPAGGGQAGAAGGTRTRASDAIAAVGLIDRSALSLQYNPGEVLALQALFARLGGLSGRARRSG